MVNQSEVKVLVYSKLVSKFTLSHVSPISSYYWSETIGGSKFTLLKTAQAPNSHQSAYMYNVVHYGCGRSVTDEEAKNNPKAILRHYRHASHNIEKNPEK